MCIHIASHKAGGEGSEMNLLTFPQGPFEYPFLLLFKSTVLPRYFPPVLLYSLYFLVYYLHCRCLSLGITLRLSWPKSISCYWHLKYFLFQSSSYSTLSNIIWKFYEKHWENFMENIVYYFIHWYATSSKLCCIHIPPVLLLNMFKVKCPRVGRIADVIHAHGRDPHRSPCLDTYSFSSNLGLVSHINKTVVGLSLLVLWLKRSHETSNQTARIVYGGRHGVTEGN